MLKTIKRMNRFSGDHAQKKSPVILRRALLALAVTAVAIDSGSASAGTYTYKLDAAATNWNDSATWTPTSPATGFANASGDIANLPGPGSTGIAVNNVISLNQAITVGTINMGDASTVSYVIQSGTGGAASTLTFNNGGSGAQLNLTNAASTGNNAVTAPIVLADSLAINSAAGAAGRVFTISGGITSSTTKNLSLNANSSGAITISGGSLNNIGTVTNGGSNSGLTTINAVIGANVTALSQSSSTSALVLTGNNTFSGNTRITAGTLQLGAASGTTTLALQNSTLDLNTTDAGSLNFGTAATTGIIAATFGGLTGSRTLSVQNINTTPAAVALSVGNNNSTNSYSGALTGSGSLIKIGSGTQTLSGSASSFTGSTTVLNGALVAGADALATGTTGAFGNSSAGAILVGDTVNTTTENASLVTGGAFTIGRSVSVRSGNAGTATLGGSTANASSFTGNISLNKAVTLTAADGGTVDFSAGTWSTGDNAVAIVGAGAVHSGIVKISNTLSTKGAVDVNSGTLTVNGILTQSNSTGASGVSVAAGATLSGSGTIGKAVSVSGTLSPGDGVGSLEVDSLTLLSGSSYAVAIAGNGFALNGSEQYDRTKVSSTGSAALGGGALAVSLGSYTLQAADLFGILQNESSGTAGAFSNYSEGSVIATNNGYNLKITYAGNVTDTGVSKTGGNDVVLYTQAVPEPAAIGLIGLGLAGLLRRRRRD